MALDKFDIRYDEHDGITYVKYTGEINTKDIIEYVEWLGKRKYLPHELRIMSDMARASFREVMQDELPLILRVVKDILPHFHYIRDALIPASPHETALTMLYEKLSLILENYYIKVFSTEEAALKWLKTG